MVRDGTVAWRAPQPVPRSGHGYKYGAVYAVDGVRVIGFDNERSKGDHCHLHGRELPYNFATVDALVEDFIAAVDAARRTPRRHDAGSPSPSRPKGVQPGGKRARPVRPTDTKARRWTSKAPARSSAD
jgi:hypothetical protein